MLIFSAILFGLFWPKLCSETMKLSIALPCPCPVIMTLVWVQRLCFIVWCSPVCALEENKVERYPLPVFVTHSWSHQGLLLFSHGPQDLTRPAPLFIFYFTLTKKKSHCAKILTAPFRLYPPHLKNFGFSPSPPSPLYLAHKQLVCT